MRTRAGGSARSARSPAPFRETFLVPFPGALPVSHGGLPSTPDLRPPALFSRPHNVQKTHKDDDEKKRGRIYVTYTKLNLKTSRYYVGRTSMIADLTKPLEEQAQIAVDTRDAHHHMDENDDPKDPAFLPAQYDRFDVGSAIDYQRRYGDIAYFRIRGREQQLIDFYGGAQSDTGKPYRTENAVRAVAKDNPQGRSFHEAATAQWGQLHQYTGR